MTEKWIKKDRPWTDYPIGTKAKQDNYDSYFVKVDSRWQDESNGAMFIYPPYCELVMLPKIKNKKVRK